MSEHFVIINQFYESKKIGGGSIFLESIIKSLLSSGKTVTQISIVIDKMDIKKNYINKKEFSNIILNSNLNAFQEIIKKWKYDEDLTKKIKSIISKKEGNILFFGYEVLSLINLKSLKQFKTTIVLGDPYHEVTKEGLKNYFNSRLFKDALKKINFFKILKIILVYFLTYLKWRSITNRLKFYDQVVCFSPYHHKWYKKFNIKTFYFPAPVFKNKIKVTHNLILKKIKKKNKKILFISKNLSGTASKNGLKNLLNLIDQELEVFLESKNIKIEICGGNFPKDLKKLFFSKRVFIYKEFINLDLVHEDYYLHLNTIDQKLGARTRIITCFSYGIPSISHKKARFGIPFLENKNSGAFLYEKKETFKQLLIKIINDNFLYLENCTNGYKIYKQKFLPDKFIENILSLKS